MKRRDLWYFSQRSYHVIVKETVFFFKYYHGSGKGAKEVAKCLHILCLHWRNQVLILVEGTYCNVGRGDGGIIPIKGISYIIIFSIGSL